MARGRLTGWRFAVFIGTFVGSVGTTLYFTAFRPMLNPEPYREYSMQ